MRRRDSSVENNDYCQYIASGNVRKFNLNRQNVLLGRFLVAVIKKIS